MPSGYNTPSTSLPISGAAKFRVEDLLCTPADQLPKSSVLDLEEFTCSICRCFFHEPVQLHACGHIYCSDCILPRSGVVDACPLCREPIPQPPAELRVVGAGDDPERKREAERALRLKCAGGELHKVNKPLFRMMNRVQVRCPYSCKRHVVSGSSPASASTRPTKRKCATAKGDCTIESEIRKDRVDPASPSSPTDSASSATSAGSSSSSSSSRSNASGVPATDSEELDSDAGAAPVAGTTAPERDHTGAALSADGRRSSAEQPAVSAEMPMPPCSPPSGASTNSNMLSSAIGAALALLPGGAGESAAGASSDVVAGTTGEGAAAESAGGDLHADAAVGDANAGVCTVLMEDPRPPPPATPVDDAEGTNAANDNDESPGRPVASSGSTSTSVSGGHEDDGNENIEAAEQDDGEDDDSTSPLYCTWVGDYGDLLSTHLSVCPFHVISCPEGCGATFPRSQLGEHLELDCRHTAYCKCEICGEDVAVGLALLGQNGTGKNDKQTRQRVSRAEALARHNEEFAKVHVSILQRDLATARWSRDVLEKKMEVRMEQLEKKLEFVAKAGDDVKGLVVDTKGSVKALEDSVVNQGTTILWGFNAKQAFVEFDERQRNAPGGAAATSTQSHEIAKSRKVFVPLLGTDVWFALYSSGTAIHSDFATIPLLTEAGKTTIGIYGASALVNGNWQVLRGVRGGAGIAVPVDAHTQGTLLQNANLGDFRQTSGHHSGHLLPNVAPRASLEHEEEIQVILWISHVNAVVTMGTA